MTLVRLFAAASRKIRRDGIGSTLKRGIQIASDRFRRSSDHFNLSTTDISSLPGQLASDKRPIRLTSIRFEATTWCNLKCAGCPRTLKVETGEWLNQHLTREVFERVLPNLPPADSLDLHGIGEPTLNPDLPAIIGSARKSGKFGTIIFTTNILGRGPEFYDGLFERGLTRITVSVDSLLQDVASAARHGTKVEKLEQRLRQLVAAHPGQVRVNSVVSTVTLPTLGDLLRRLDDIAADSGKCLELTLAIFDDFDGAGLTERRIQPTVGDELASKIGQWREEFPHLRISSGWDAVVKPTGICRKPLAATLDSQGYLLPCAHVHDPALLSHLDLKQHRFDDAIRTPYMVDFFSDFVAQSPAFCKGCGNDVPRRHAEAVAQGKALA